MAFAAALVATAATAGDFIFKYPTPERGKEDGRKVCIRKITDAREFEDRPAKAETPSLAAGKENTDEKTRQRAVARVRDGYGKARSNVFLGADEDVMKVMRRVIGDGLAAQGFALVEEGKADKDTQMLDVSIQKFWGWIDINAGGGFTGSGTMTMTADIETELTFAEGGLKEKKKVPISVRSEARLGIGVTGRAWQNTFLKAFTEYQGKLAKAGV
jgi:hypothetical protein